jgi:hypothetical protein
VSSSRLGFSFYRPELFDIGLDGNSHLVSRVEGTIGPAELDIRVGFAEAGIDDPALGRRILIIDIGKFGSVNHHLGSEYNLASQHRRFNQVAFGYAYGGAETARQSHLALAVNFNESGHHEEIFNPKESRKARLLRVV